MQRLKPPLLGGKPGYNCPGSGSRGREMGKVRDDTNGIEYIIRTSNEHFRAHIHIFYAGGAASIALDKVEVLARRKMPEKKLQEALAWIARHRAELEQMYANQELPGGIYKIQD